jgi:hypothetical protein
VDCVCAKDEHPNVKALRLNLFLAEQKHGHTKDASKILSKIYKEFALANHPDKHKDGTDDAMVQGNQVWAERPKPKDGRNFPDPRPLRRRNPPVSASPKFHDTTRVCSTDFEALSKVFRDTPVGQICREADAIYEREKAEWFELCKRKPKITKAKKKVF